MRSLIFSIVIVLFIPVVIGNPLFGVIGYSCLNIIRPEMIRLTTKIQMILMSVTFIGIVFNFSKMELGRLVNWYLILWLLLYAGIINSLYFSSLDLPRGYHFAEDILKTAVLLGLVLLMVKDGKSIHLYQNALLGAICLLGLWGIEQHFQGNVRLEGLGGRSIQDSNGIAALFVLFLPLTLSKIQSADTKFKKMSGVIASAISILLIVFTGSRGGFLGMSICFIYLFKKSKHKFRMFFLSVLILTCTIPFVSEQYIDRINTIFVSNDKRDGSAASRLVFWKAGLMIFSDNMINGVGFMGYSVEKLKYEKHFWNLDPRLRSDWFRKKNPYVSHSTYIQLLSETGLLGTVPFLLMLGGTVVSNYRLRKRILVNSNNRKLFILLDAIETGIISFSACIAFINGILFVFLPIQVVVSSIIRKEILKIDEITRDIEKDISPAAYFQKTVV